MRRCLSTAVLAAMIWPATALAQQTESAPAATANPAAPAAPPAPEATEKVDEIAEAGYLPGYRPDHAFGLSPFAPRVPASAGGMLPAFGAPTPTSEWVFRFSGFLSISAQYSLNERPETVSGQSKLVFHSPPATIDEYASFVGTSTMPGQWVMLNFSYGNRDVTANVNLTTWNPSDPTTYYQLGSESFITNAYLAFNLGSIGKLRPRAAVGYFYNNYGALGQYGLGLYQNAATALVRGVGEQIYAEYPLTPKLSLTLEEGFMGNRNGRNPSGTAPGGPNNGADPTWPASFVAHAHAGLVARGEQTTLRATFHYIYNWAQDDRTQLGFDNPVTRGIDESHVRDGKLEIFGADVIVDNGRWGRFGIGGSHVNAADAYTLKGVMLYGGEGQGLTERWLGNETGGTGTLDQGVLYYTNNLSRLMPRPGVFQQGGRDLAVSLGAMLAYTDSTNPLFGGRLRHKYGLDLFYTLFPFMGVGVRGDRVVPNSHVAEETFHVLAGRLVFRTNWASHEQITLLYAKWFYGPESHAEYSAVVAPRLDDQLIALNVNMWW